MTGPAGMTPPRFWDLFSPEFRDRARLLTNVQTIQKSRPERESGLDGGVESPYVTSMEHFRGISHEEICAEVAKIQPAELGSLADTWMAEQTDLMFAVVGFDAKLQRTIGDTWRGAAADSAVAAVSTFAASASEMNTALHAVGRRLHEVRFAAEAVVKSVPPPVPGLGTPLDLLVPGAGMARAEAAAAAHQAAIHAMETVYQPSYQGAGDNVPIIPAPYDPIADGSVASGSVAGSSVAGGSVAVGFAAGDPGGGRTVGTAAFDAPTSGGSNAAWSAPSGGASAPSLSAPSGGASAPPVQAHGAGIPSAAADTQAASVGAPAAEGVPTGGPAGGAEAGRGVTAGPVGPGQSVDGAGRVGSSGPGTGPGGVGGFGAGVPGGGAGGGRWSGSGGPAGQGASGGLGGGRPGADGTGRGIGGGIPTGAGVVSGGGSGVAGSGASGTRGGVGAGMVPVAGRGGPGDDAQEHRIPSYLVNVNNGNELIGELPLVAPPVLGA